MILPVITEGNPILRQRGTEVADVSDPKIQALIDDMIETMYAKDGVGLAAPQVSASLQIAVIVADPEKFEDCRNTGREPLIIINPQITSHSFFQKSGEEGCLSVPTICGLVRRWKSITVTYLDRNGAKHKLRAKNLMARVIQHEIDHLNGILFIDKADKLFNIKPL